MDNMMKQIVPNKYAKGFQDAMNRRLYNDDGLTDEQKVQYDAGYTAGVRNRCVSQAWAQRASWVI